MPSTIANLRHTHRADRTKPGQGGGGSTSGRSFGFVQDIKTPDIKTTATATKAILDTQISDDDLSLKRFEKFHRMDNFDDFDRGLGLDISRISAGLSVVGTGTGTQPSSPTKHVGTF